jgi:hypothetical protein
MELTLILKRAALRPLLFLLLAIIAMASMQSLTVLTGSPELMRALQAGAFLAMAESMAMLLRIVQAPALDVQAAAQGAETNAMASAIVFAVHRLTWLARMVLFVYVGWAS